MGDLCGAYMSEGKGKRPSIHLFHAHCLILGPVGKFLIYHYEQLLLSSRRKQWL